MAKYGHRLTHNQKVKTRETYRVITYVYFGIYAILSRRPRMPRKVRFSVTNIIRRTGGADAAAAFSARLMGRWAAPAPVIRVARTVAADMIHLDDGTLIYVFLVRKSKLTAGGGMTQRKIELVLTATRARWRAVGEPGGGPASRFDANVLKADVAILTDVLRTYAGARRNIKPGEGMEPPDAATVLTYSEGNAIKKMVERLADAVEEVAPYVRDDDEVDGGR